MSTSATAILAIESSQAHCSAAVWRGGTVVAQRREPEPNRQAAMLLPCIEGVLADAGMGYTDLTLLACTLGPGSFTAIRVGLATARAISLASGLMLHGYGSLRLLAWQAMQHEPEATLISVAANAYRGQVYYQRFDRSEAAGPPEALPLDALAVRAEEGLRVGDGWALAGIASLNPQGDAASLAEMAAAGHDPDGIEPIYVREPDAKAQKAPPVRLE